MAIQSMTSNVSAYTNSGTQTQIGPAQQGQQTQQAEKREPRAEERGETQEEKPRPVTNVQGQRTGTLINVTA